MAIHDWTRVPASIFHAFHHRWISAIGDVMNLGLLPKEYYALPEQQAAGFGHDVLTLQSFVAETEAEFYRRKKSSIVVRHVTGDRIVAVAEIVSPGNKASRLAFQAFVDKAYELLEHRIHLLIIDLLPRRRGDRRGVHSAIWGEVQDELSLPVDKPLTLVTYECEQVTQAYIEPVGVGDVLPDMALFLEPGSYVTIPLETTYQTAFSVMPLRWRQVLEEHS